VDAFDLVQANLLSPVVLAFVLGLAATRLRSDLDFPRDLYSALAIYLLLAVGLKGGVSLSVTPASELWKPALATLTLGAATPLWCIWILQHLGRFSRVDAAAIAAHYGSVSVVTFLAASTYLDAAKVEYEGFMPALVALLEVPAIVVALLLARRGDASSGSAREALREVLTGKSIVLLVGGTLIGLVSGKSGVAPVAPLFEGLFCGALVLFLLEMGLVTGRRLGDLKRVGSFLILFGVLMPLVHAVLGIGVARLAGMSEGGAALQGVLAASASYIAAPGAVRIALPSANPTYSLTASLAVTFPFNLVVGIPLYHELAQRIYA